MEGTGILTLQQASAATTMGAAGARARLITRSCRPGRTGQQLDLPAFRQHDGNWRADRRSHGLAGAGGVSGGSGRLYRGHRCADGQGGERYNLTFSGPTSLGANVSTAAATGGAQDITFNDDVTLTANAQVLAGNGDITFTGTIDGAFDLTLNAAGTITSLTMSERAPRWMT